MTKVIAMFAACGVGCSWIAVSGPPSPLPEHGMVTCSDSYVAPIVDSVVAAIGVLALVVAAGPCNSDACTGNGGDGQGIGTRGLLVVTGVALAPFGISALYGYSKVSNCNEANGPQARREVAEHAAALRAENLTNAAVLAARAGDCATVKRLDAQVMQLDPGLHQTLFHDPRITRCLPPEEEIARKQARQAAKQHLEEDAKKHSLCLQQRHESFARVGTISDPQERARLLESIPVCSDETPPTPPTAPTAPTREESPSDFDRRQAP